MQPSDRIHIVLASTQATWHGGEKQAALLAQGILARGLDCSIVARAGSEFASRMAGEGFHVATFPGNGRSPAAWFRIRQALKLLKPHVLHANDAHALTAVGVAGLGLKIPLRVVARRVDFPVRSKWRYERFAQGTICVSHAVARICTASGLEPSRLYVVHDGVEPEFAESGSRTRGRQSLQLNDQQTLLLTVAKLTDHKGHTYLLRALPEILARHPRVVLALAGDGELRDSLATQATELGIARHVRFLGYRNDVADLLSAADIVVQPSHMEGLCSSLIDAMLAARPIVATRAGGIPDLLDSCPTEPPVAWLVPAKAPQALAQAINEAIADPLSQARGLRARARALLQFTAEQMVHRTLETYARIARGFPGDRAACRISELLTLAANKTSERPAA